MTEEEMAASIKYIEESTKCIAASFHELGRNLSSTNYNRRLAMVIIDIKTTSNILKRTEEKLTSHLLENLAGKEENNE